MVTRDGPFMTSPGTSGQDESIIARLRRGLDDGVALIGCKAVGDKFRRDGAPMLLRGGSIMQRHLAGAAFVAVIASLAPPAAQAQLLPVSIELGDVSLTKLPFVMAAEAGIYRRNGLEAKQYITPRAAELIRQSSGVVVPEEFLGTGIGDINIGGGSPTLVRMTSD